MEVLRIEIFVRFKQAVCLHENLGPANRRFLINKLCMIFLFLLRVLAEKSSMFLFCTKWAEVDGQDSCTIRKQLRSPYFLSNYCLFCMNRASVCPLRRISSLSFMIEMISFLEGILLSHTQHELYFYLVWTDFSFPLDSF